MELPRFHFFERRRCASCLENGALGIVMLKPYLQSSDDLNEHRHVSQVDEPLCGVDPFTSRLRADHLCDLDPVKDAGTRGRRSLANCTRLEELLSRRGCLTLGLIDSFLPMPRQVVGRTSSTYQSLATVGLISTPLATWSLRVPAILRMHGKPVAGTARIWPRRGVGTG